MRVVAAIDNSGTARAVLSAASTFANLLQVDVTALHVRAGGGWDTARAAASAAGIPVKIATGPTLESIVAEAGQTDVTAVVLGTRGATGGRRPAGHIAMGVATAVMKPVVVVPPDARYPVRLWRLLVPLEGSLMTADAVHSMIRALCKAGAEVIVLHVIEDDAVPAVTDQPQHEVDAWVAEFKRRYCDDPDIRIELRAGGAVDHVLATAETLEADAVLLAWGQRVAGGRGARVTSILERSQIPVILVPVNSPASNRCEGPCRPQTARGHAGSLRSPAQFRGR
jgi:nucleotide-binding universal stress UspA family protein